MSGHDDELVSLVTRLREIEERIVELTGGSVDAVMDRHGKPWLLSSAQQELRERSQLQHRFSEQQTALLNALPAHIALLDAGGHIIDVNEAWRHFGETNELIDPAHGIGNNYLDVCDAAPLDDVEAHRTAAGLRAILAGKQDSFSLEYPCHGPDTQRWFNLVAAPLRTFHEGGVVIMHIDITDRKLAELELQRAASLFNSSNDGVMITDAQGIIRDVNPAFYLITGFSREEVLGQPVAVHHELNRSGVSAEISRALEQYGHWNGELRARRKDASMYILKVSVSAIKGEAGQALNYIAVLSDITQMKAHEEELDRVANHDGLTGLPNRRLLSDRLEQTVLHAQRHHGSLAVCYLDLDNFKPVNDRLGHAAGDLVLIEVARRIVKVLRESDTVSRIGGDEFVLLLPDIAGSGELDEVLARVLAELRKPFVLDEGTARVSASIGAALFPDDADSADTLLRYADQAMYSAKEDGRDRYFRFDSREAEHSDERRSRLRSIMAGLENKEFELYYQPKVDLRDGNVIGFEALARWQHPEHGLLAPASFLEFVIGSDFELRFGDYVLETALAQLAHWQNCGLHLQVSINVSGNELRQPGLSERLAAGFNRHHGINPDQLEIEVLETTAIKDIDQVLIALSQCRSSGVQVSLDDFGTGYASLSVFRRLPVDTLKIDQSFVRDMLEDSDDCSIVESVIQMAKAFNRNVVAEGVESMEHARALMALGCFQAQGFGIARPMPAAEVPGWIDEWRRQHKWEAARRV